MELAHVIMEDNKSKIGRANSPVRVQGLQAREFPLP